MKFTLKDYQEEAVDDVLRTLERASTAWKRDGAETSVALTAPTGAGKTVMAAAVIEALFYGSEKFDIDPDVGAVVLWFSDDPNLNDQTRTRLMDASEKFTSSDLVAIEPPFAKAKLDPGRVYFLNTQKLSKSSKLTRGHVEDGSQLALPGAPDLQGYTIWETIANTVADEDLTLYLVLDEAHRGFNTRTSSDKTTIVRRLVQGHAGYPPIPIVWGISATIDRFDTAMQEADASKDRRAFPPVMVDPNRYRSPALSKTLLASISQTRPGTSIRHWSNWPRKSSPPLPNVGLPTRRTKDSPRRLFRCSSYRRRTRRLRTRSEERSTPLPRCCRDFTAATWPTCSVITRDSTSASGT